MARKPKDNSFHGIPTKYKNIQFRSRLEAKWAAFFDLLGWSWEYEPFDLNGWIPDFSISREKRAFLAEIKPASTFKELDEHVQKIENGKPERDFLVCGSSLFDVQIETEMSTEQCLSPGLYGSCFLNSTKYEYCLAPSVFAKCRCCEKFIADFDGGVFDNGWCEHCNTEYGCRPITAAEREHILSLFRQAANVVQWKGSR